MCELAGEKDRPRVLSLMRDHLHPDQRIFVGVIDPINPKSRPPPKWRTESSKRLSSSPRIV